MNWPLFVPDLWYTITIACEGKKNIRKFSIYHYLIFNCKLKITSSLSFSNLRLIFLLCMNVLIVEDDKKMVNLLQTGLKDQGVVSDAVSIGSEAVDRILSHDYDVIVLDIMLPGELNGFAVCREIRKEGVNTPIIMVTARESVEDRVRGLDAGADDYLPKPFSLEELLARLRALVRRGRALDQPVLQVADLILDPSRRVVERAGKPINLSKKEFRLLEYLMRNKNRVITRTMLIEHIWGYKIDYNSKVVDVYINYIRKKVDKDFDKKLVQTVRGVGYIIKD